MVVLAVGGGGERLPLDPSLQPEVISLIMDCWNQEPMLRPSFTEIIRRLSDLTELKCVEPGAVIENPGTSSSGSRQTTPNGGGTAEFSS